MRAREETVLSLSGRTVDLLVIGGGIIGAGIARDAALRGLSVALVEQNDFASGTSSRPTRLIHGGLRYLELFDFGLVRSDMREREILLHIAPHLVFPLPFLLPLYRPSLWYQAKLRIGMQLYDALSLDKSLPKRRYLRRDAALAAEPNLNPDGLHGAWRFYDAQVPLIERLVIENLVDAAEHGALVLNHAPAVGYLREGERVVGARVRDDLGGREIEIRAEYTVNATGPWLDRTIAPLRLEPKPLLRITKGIHLVVPRATEHAHVLFAKSDGRLFFVIPWLDQTLIGTTDTDYQGDPQDAAATEDDVRYLQTEAARAFPNARFDHIHYAWAGIRALVRVEGVSEGEVSRKHALFDHAREGVHGVLSVVGGKITAYRDIAEETTDHVSLALGRRTRCTTASTPLPGARGEIETRGLHPDPFAHLRRVYGYRALAVTRLGSDDESLGDQLCADHQTSAAEVVHAVRNEWAMTIGDVLLRRTTLGLQDSQGIECVDAVADRMAALLGWDAQRRRAEVEAYRREIEPMRRFSVT
jgi:glycerol-3-phosphate dehydrogenase